MAHEIQLSQENLPSQIRRNIKGGLLIGLVLAAWKFKGSYQDILRSASIDVTRIRGQEPSEITITVHSSSKQYHIFTNPRIRFLVAFLRYFKNYPLFLASFTVIFKAFIHSKGLLHSNGITLNLSHNKYRIALFTAFLSYLHQRTFDCFTWNWALFLLIRSLYSLSRLLVPSDLQPATASTYPIVHSVLGLCLAFHCKYVPSKWWNMVEQCVGEKKQRWLFMLGNHHHGILPPCAVAVHERDEDGHFECSCLRSFFRDNARRSVSILIFFGKFYAFTTLLGTQRLIDAAKNRTLGSLLLLKMQHVLGSFGFFMIGVAVAGRVPCALKWMLWRMEGGRYGDVAVNSKAAMLSACAVLGRVSILCEAESRRTDVALSCVWNVTQQMIRMGCGLESEDNARYHRVLGSNQFTSILFAVNMWITMMVYCSDRKYVKNMERTIIAKYLMG